MDLGQMSQSDNNKVTSENVLSTSLSSVICIHCGYGNNLLNSNEETKKKTVKDNIENKGV